MARKSSTRPQAGTRGPGDGTAGDPAIEDAEIVGEIPAEDDTSAHGPGAAEVKATPGAGGEAVPDANGPTSSVEAQPGGEVEGLTDPYNGPDAGRGAGDAPGAGVSGEDGAADPGAQDARIGGDTGSDVVRAPSVDLVPPPGEALPEEPQEPTAADAPEVIEVPAAEGQSADETGIMADDPGGRSSMPRSGAAAAFGATAADGDPEDGASARAPDRSPAAPSAPEPGAPGPSRGGLGAMLLGGLLAGAVGFGLAWFLEQGPREAARAESGALAARLAALESDDGLDIAPIEARLADLEGSVPDTAPIEARLAELENSVPDTAPLDARLTEVEGALGNVADTATFEAVAERLAALEGGLAGLTDAANAPQPDSDTPAVTAEAVGAVETVTTENADRLASVEDRIAALPEGLSDLPGTVDALRGDLGGLSGRVDSLSGELDTVSGSVDAVSGTLDGVSGSVEALTGTVDTISTDVDSLQGTIEEVRDSVQSRQEAVEAERLALEAAAEEEARTLRAEAAITQLGAAIATGAPLDAALIQWQDATGGSVPGALATNAAEGVASLAALQSAFDPAARAAIAVAPAAPGPAGFLRAQVGLRSLAERDGTDVDAVLSRAQARLSDGDLDAAVEAAAALEGAPAEAMADWLVRARARLAAIDAAEGLTVPQATEG